jgi:Holliday junction resolvase RusA-like endonuclease
MRLELPLPPMANKYWRYWRGRVVSSPEAARYKQGVRLRALTLGLKKPLEGPVCVFLTVYRKRRAGDLDGFQKILLDSLQGIAYVNDSQIAELHALRLEDPEQPRVVVTVEPMTTTSA